jgi:predicted outer membrane repeat protein
MRSFFAFLTLLVVISGNLSQGNDPLPLPENSINTPPSVIGEGTPASCTEAELDAVLMTSSSITFNCGSLPHTIFITSTKVLNAITVTLDGGGLITLDGQKAVRLFEVQSGTLSLQNITLTHGKANGGEGGAVRNAGTLNVINSTFSGNSAHFGGAIFTTGQVNVFQSAFVGNKVIGFGGAVRGLNGSKVNIANTTFSGNKSSGGGGSAVDSTGDVRISFSTFKGNLGGAALFNYGSSGSYELRSIILSDNAAGNCKGQDFINQGGNIVVGAGCSGINPHTTVNPQIGELEGNPPTLPLNPGSSAIDVSSTCAYLSVGTNFLFGHEAPVLIDQRGVARPYNALCDSGAYEFDPNALPTSTPVVTATLEVTPTPDVTITPTLVETETPEATGTVETTSTPHATTIPDSTATPSNNPIELLLNGGFEEDNTDWTTKNATSDKRKCNKPEKIIARTGDCAFQFKGGAGENSKLEQRPATTAITTGDSITLSGFYRATGAVNAKVKVTMKYTDTTLPNGKINLTLSVSSDYTAFTGDLAEVIAGEVASIKVTLQNRSTSGKVLFDDLSLQLTEGSADLMSLP